MYAHTSISSNFIISLELIVNEEKYIIIGVYRAPSCSLLSFNHNFFSMIENNINNQKTVILGDFNVDLRQNAPPQSEQMFIDNFNSESFKCLINKPTRFTDHSQKCIDHIYTNVSNEVNSGVLNLQIGDHCAVFCSFTGYFQFERNYTIKFRE